MKKYLNYSAYDLLLDTGFIHDMLSPTEESEARWNALFEESPQLRSEAELARKLFKESVRIGDHSQPDDSVESLFLQLSQRINTHKRRTSRFRRLAVAASCAACIAIAALAIGLRGAADDDAYILGVNSFETTGNVSFGEVTLIRDNSAITLANDRDIVLGDLLSKVRPEEGVEGETTVADGGQIIHLIVPSGRRSALTLDDGSTVWVNAGSRISFPETFTGATREVSVEGEVYFAVVKDPSRPFIVDAGGVGVKVLGTEFGITAYGDEVHKSVVLVNGAVEVSIGSNPPVKMHPNQRLTVDGGAKTYHIAEVDVMDHVSWKSGWLQADSTDLGDLMARLSRYYGRRIVCDDAVQDLTCSGKLLLTDDIETQLRIVCRNMGIRYTITADQILLHP
ncbi:FecR domain-containing protein [Alistipes sp. OttesenSCG-928-B03]|nr:FecR domain-containing protein [Alistipes sp. OttesenSCG-928-B03]